MMHWALLVAALGWSGPLEEIFLPVLESDQLKYVGESPKADQLASLMRPDQKAAARAALEKAPLSDEDRAHGFQLLDDPIAAYRAEARARGLLPTPSGEVTAQASAALKRGDNEAAARLAAEALALDPSDQNAFGILKLTDRRVTAAEPPLIEASALGAPPAAHAAVAVAPPAPRAAALMREAVAARRAGDMDATLRASLDAMRADPTSPEVQELYKLVTADRAKQQARVQRTLSLMEKAAEAMDDGRKGDAERLARDAAELDPNSVGYWEKLRRILEERAKNTPPPAKSRAPKPRNGDSEIPLFPIAAGSLLLTVGAFAWYHWGRDKSSKLQRDATIIAIAAGTAGLLYVGWTALPAVTRFGGAAPAPAVGPAAGAAAEAMERAANPTRPSDAEIAETKALGKSYLQRAGGKVYLHEVEPGKFNVYIEAADGKMITGIRHTDARRVRSLARDYGWQGFE